MCICTPYEVRAQESELSRRQRFGVFLGTHEQYASLTSCIRRRRASLPGGCVHPEKTTGHEVEVGPSSRRCLISSRPSYHITMRPFRTLGSPPGPLCHVERHRAALSLVGVRTQSGMSARRGDGRGRLGPLHRPWCWTSEPAGRICGSMWHPGYPDKGAPWPS